MLPDTVNPVRGIPTSRAYWELKAEQVMNRVFSTEPTLELEIVPAATPAESTPPKADPVAKRHRPVPAGGTPSPVLLGRGLALVALLLSGATLVGLGLWSQHQQALQQERNMLLIELLRNLSSSPAQPAAVATGEGPSLPPPPPDEPWMQELAALPSSSAPAARVLQVPLSARLDSPAPAAQEAPTGRTGAEGSTTNLPQLVGVIQIPGRSGSAIFQVDGNSTSAVAGESIGSSGWTLQSASGDGAVIKRGGVTRRLTISSGF